MELLTCSSCSCPVPIPALADHVCSPVQKIRVATPPCPPRSTPPTTTPKPASPSPSMPYYLEENIDTSTGGEAGMAGVGRRGFAAVARAAMFAANHQRRPEPPRLLDIDAAIRATTEPPPLSAGSSHSAGRASPFPQTPLTPDPFPSNFLHSPASNTFPEVQDSPITPSIHSPLSRMPFFEKFKNNPNITSDHDLIYHSNPLPDTPSTAVPLYRSPNHRYSPSSPSEADSVSHYAPSPPPRTTSLSSTTSRTLRDDINRSASPSSSSEGGLAYAESDGNDTDDSSCPKIIVKQNTLVPISILRSGSATSSARIRFPSVDTTSTVRSQHAGTPALTPKIIQHTKRNRNDSTSSTSSAGGRDKTNSSLIAQALGLSGTPPRDYGKLGGPGVTGFGGRLGHSPSVTSSGSSGSATHERRMNKFPQNEESGAALAKSKSIGYQSLDERERERERSSSGPPPPSPGAKAHRSNTVQAVHSSPESRMPKLPARSRTSPFDGESNDGDRKAADKSSERRVRVREPRVCIKCNKTIDDGRWVQCDGGTVLCDSCWKSLYLPRCRRCNMPIEKQAVSSSDGQLKVVCPLEDSIDADVHCPLQKPFPDRSFYVFDGKPLCAYHYHEANDSLCSAAHCGQPIEGPCAVSHTGDRYHPEHMTCEYPSYPRCRERLAEYWEVDGRMLCELHAAADDNRSASEWDDDDDDDGDDYYGARHLKAKKRITRFIDLTNGGVEGSDLR
ncbi:hypothetical protein APHAL10511_000946 [Amanita phalloides]|nr:hypothetical protein APHAL10511_000946 [Amanita phalloides]